MSLPSSVQAWSLPIDDESWTSHKDLQLRDVKLAPLGNDEVLVKLHATGLNYRDLIIPKQLYPRPYSSGPDGQGHILTCDGAGEIIAVGQDVTEWKHGDRVHSTTFQDWTTGELKRENFRTALGGGASGCLVQYKPFSSQGIVRIPDHLSYEQAAAITCAGLTAWACLFETNQTNPITSNSTVLTLGTGGVSVFAAQFAKAVGARVIATTSSAEKAKWYKEVIGVDEVINYRETPEWSTEVLRLTGGEGVEHVLEVGGQTTIGQSLKSTRVGGHIHVLGFVGGMDSPGITFGELSLAMIMGRLHLHGQAAGSRDMLQRLDEFIGEHKIKPAVGKVFEWKQAVEALDYLAAGSHVGKVIVKI